MVDLKVLGQTARRAIDAGSHRLFRDLLRRSAERVIGAARRIASSPAPPSDDDEAGAEQIAALFGAVTWAVLCATAAALVMVIIFVRLGFTDARRGAAFVAYIGMSAAAHIALKRAWRRDALRAVHWRWWGSAFSGIALVEGFGWGWTAYGLVASRDLPAASFCLLVSGGCAVASIPVFAFYRRAFLAFYIPATTPFIITFALSPDPFERATTLAVLIYFVAMMIFGLSSNRSYLRLVGLRIRSDDLARKLEGQIEIAEAANRAKSTFLAAASHDLRQPVHAIGLFVGALRGMPMAADAMQMIEQIEVSSQAMDGLFAALLDISSLDAGTVEVDHRMFPVAAIIERICREHASEAQAKGIAIRPCYSHVWLESDPILVERVVRNFVSNAVRYTRVGRVVVGCRRRGDHVRIEVHDSGPGIPPDQRERIFQEYYQVGNPERDRAKGLGLGLAIVRRLASLLDCALDLRSKVGRGSCFSIAVPLARRSAVAARPEHEKLSVLRSLLIVVIDDEADIRRAMTALLTGWGHRVCSAASTPEAMQRLALNPSRPDLIISDFRLRDDETGIDAIEALRIEYNEDVPAILITGDTAPERLVEARGSGLLMLHKPVSNSRLRAAIANVIDL